MDASRIKRLWTFAKGARDVMQYLIWLGSFVGWGTIMVYLGTLTGWTVAIGPLGIALIVAASFLILCAGYALYAYARRERAVAKFAELNAASGAVNVLAPIHQHERIELAKFYHPFFKPTVNARFESCELMGPASIALMGCTLDVGAFHDCEIVLCEKIDRSKGLQLLKDAHL
jgi:hypothetical protein